MKTEAKKEQLALWRGQADDYVVGLGWSPGGEVLHVLSSAGTLHLLEAATGEVRLAEKAHPAGALCLSSSPAAAVVATGGMDGHLQLRDGLSGRLLATHRLGTAWVELVQWSPDGLYLAVSAGKCLRIYNLAGEELGRYCDHESTVSALSWRSDSQALATGCYSAVRLFELVRPQEPYETLLWKNSLISLAWSPNGRFVAAGTQDARIHFWPLPYVPQTDLEMSGYASKVKELSWDGSGTFLASNCHNEIILWDVSGDGPAGTRPRVLRGHHGKISRLAFQQEGEVLASGDDIGELLLWAPQKSASPLAVESFAKEISALQWSPDQSKLAVGTAAGEVAVL